MADYLAQLLNQLAENYKSKNNAPKKVSAADRLTQLLDEEHQASNDLLQRAKSGAISTGTTSAADRLTQLMNEEYTHGEKNRGGLAGGLEYVGTKFVDGAISNVEGMTDFVAGGLANLMGFEDAAKEVFERDWYDYSRADKKFNPGKGWKVAGDVAGVVGGTLPDVAIGVGTGGLGAGATAAKVISATTNFASATGRAMKDAIEKTGKLGESEWAGAAGSGALASGIELVSGGVGEITGKAFGKTAVEMGSEIGESLTKRLSGKLVKSESVKEIFGEMTSEALEEGLESYIEPYIIRGTYDPNAENASAGDILYSMFLGGTAGGVSSGANITLRNAVNIRNGKKVTADEGKLDSLIREAEDISIYEQKRDTGSSVFEAVINQLEKVKKFVGKATEKYTADELRQIGELEALVATAAVEPATVKAAMGIAENAESMAEQLNTYYRKTGRNRQITAAQLTKGLKLDGNSKEFVRSVRHALRMNGTLREVVISNMLGRMEFDANAYAQSIYGDTKIENIATAQNLNRFLSNVDQQTLAQLSEALQIDDWSSITPEELAAKISDFRDSGRAESYREGVNAARKAKKTAEYTNGMPERVESLKGEINRFKSEGADFAIIREGDGYRLYDYDSGHITRAITAEEMDALVNRIKERQISFKEESDMMRLDRELDGFAEQNVPEYKKLTESEREAVRQTLRYARAQGISEKDQILFGRIAAKSGMNVIVEPTLKNDDPAQFDGRNTIYINASAPRTKLYSGLLGHEMWHKMFKDTNAKRQFMQAWNNIDEAKRNEVIAEYMKAEQERGRSFDEASRISAEEVAAAYAEELFNYPHVWEIILDGEPTIKEKVISFFTGAPGRYDFAPEMDPAAKKWLREYKKLFDQVAERNAGASVAENVGADNRVLKVIGKVTDDMIVSGERSAMAGVNAKTADKLKLSTVEQMLKDGVDSETVRRETGWFKGYDGKWRFEIDDSEMAIIKKHLLLVDGEYTLNDIISHKALFEAYPELAEMKINVRFGGNGIKGSVGAYNADTNTITLNRAIWLPDNDIKKVLIHEIQHRIQRIEGFARGSSPEYWREKGIPEGEYNRFVEQTEVEFNKELRKLSSDDANKVRAYFRLMERLDTLLGKVDFGDDVTTQKVLDEASKIETQTDELYNYLYYKDWFAKINDLYNQTELSDNLHTVFYKNTAGEIEARDAAERINLTAEQRKNTRPEIDRKDVVFADSDENLSYVGKTKDGRRCYESDFDSNLSMDAKVELFKERIATIFNLGAVELKTDVKKIIIKGDRFTVQKNIYGDKVNSKTEQGAKINSLYDLADILATATYDPAATNAEESYRNPGTKPKNKAHKGVKYWYKFKNEIVFDGVPYSVTFNIRDKGIDQYQYLIEFKENKTPGLSNTVASNLLRTDQASYGISISQNSQNSNTSGEISSKNVDSGSRSAIKTEADYKAEADARVAKATEKANARAEKQVAKVKATADKKVKGAEERTAKKLEAEKSKLMANYLTDSVFDQSTVNKALEQSAAFKTLPKDVQADYARRILLEMNKSDSPEWRRSLEITFTVDIANKILFTPGSGYDMTNVLDRKRLNDELSRIMQSITSSGKRSARARIEGELRAELHPDRLREEIRAEERLRGEYLSEIYRELKKIDNTKHQRFLAASDYHSEEFKTSIEALTKMDWRGKLNDSIVRSQMQKLLQWYRRDNPMLQEFKRGDFKTSAFDWGIANRIEMLSTGEGKLSNSELEMLSDTLKYFAKLINEYSMVYVEGKWQSGEDLVYEMRDVIEKQNKMKVPFAIRALRNKFLSGGLKAFGDPLSVIKLCDMYENGIFTRTYKDWMQGEINAETEALLIKEEYDAFMKKNRFYPVSAEKHTVKLHGVQMSRMQLVEYVMTLKRKGSWLGIASEGFVFTDKSGNDVEVRPIAPIAEGKDYMKRLEAAITKERDAALRLLTPKDREYMAILERGYSKASETKAAGDMKRLGFVNLVDGYYYPIKRAYTEHISEFDAELFAVDRYANASFNKKTMEKAKAALRIGSADSTFNRHVRGVARYMHLSPVMDSFNKLYKMKILKTKPGIGADISALMKLQGSTFSVQSLIAQSNSTWRVDGKIVGFDYLQNLMLDTMGRNKAVGDGVAGRFRSGYVGFALGGNPKVIFTQFSSLLASTSVLDMSSHLRGAFVWQRGMDNYSAVARLRDSDYSVAKAQGVVDNISSAAKFFTLGMSYADRFVVYRAWAACQAQVAKNGGPRIGSEENSIVAGKLLDKVILETQQNALASRKTEGARRGNMLTKTMLMFKSDAITTHGRVIDAWGEAAYLQAKSKAEGVNLDKEIEASKKQLGRAISAVAMSSVYMVVVSEMFRAFYGKDDEDEKKGEKWLRRFGEFLGNMLGGIPILSEIYGFFTSGYELSAMEFSAINDLLSTSMDIFEYSVDVINGKATERDGNRLIEKMLYGAGQFFGIPLRNIKNLTYGILSQIDPEKAYKWNAALYDQSYGADLENALEKGDMQMAETILELALGEKLGSGLSKGAIDELLRLAKLGESVLPTAVGDTVTIDGEERSITGTELAEIREIYAGAIEQINSITKSAFYKSLGDEEKASAIRKIYSLYKDLAYDRVLGTERDKKAVLLSKVISDEVLCVYKVLGLIESDKDANGETVEGSRREKIVNAIGALNISDHDKLLLIAMNGYTLTGGDIPGMTGYEAKDTLFDYIGTLGGISEESRLEIYESCGFEVKGTDVQPPMPETGDFKYAVSNGKTDMAKDILNVLTENRIGREYDSKTTAELTRLAGLGEKIADKVLPSAIGDTVTVNDTERELSDSEREAITEKYGEAAERIGAFIGSELYKSFSDEQKASAIDKILTMYKNLGYDSVLGTKNDADALALSGVVSPDVLCAFEAMGVIESDKDENGETVSGSKRIKVLSAISALDISDEEKLMLMAAKGYALKDDDLPGVTSYQAKMRLYSYIASLDIQSSARLDLYRMCGFEIKDGTPIKPEYSKSNSESKSTTSRRSSGGSLLGGGSLANKSGILASASKNRVRRIGKIQK